MTNIVVPHRFKPRDYQLDLFRAMDGVPGRPETRKKRAFVRWHRRAGKDKACIAYMFKEMIARVGLYYYFLPTYQQGKKAIWEGMDRDGMRLIDHMPQELIASTNKNELKMELTNGSIFRVVGTDDVDSVMGVGPVGCVFSEYSLQTPGVWDLIRPMLIENDGWAIFNGTPRGRDHMYDLEMRVATMYNWYVSELQTLWPDRPNYSGLVSPEQIQEERDAGMEEERVESEFGVSYTAGVKGAFYSDQIDQARKERRIGAFPPDLNLRVDTFWDLGRSDDTAIWFRQMDGNRLVFVDYYEASGKDLAHFVRVLEDKGYRYRTHYIPWDGNSRTVHIPQNARELLEGYMRDAGMSADVAVVPKSLKMTGINAARKRFPRYHFNEGLCMDGLTKLSLYHRRFDKKLQSFLPEPVHDWTSHAADALRTEAMADDEYSGNWGTNPDTTIQVHTSYDLFDAPRA